VITLGFMVSAVMDGVCLLYDMARAGRAGTGGGQGDHAEGAVEGGEEWTRAAARAGEERWPMKLWHALWFPGDTWRQLGRCAATSRAGTTVGVWGPRPRGARDLLGWARGQTWCLAGKVGWPPAIVFEALRVLVTTCERW
jgi:hypothetical protein